MNKKTHHPDYPLLISITILVVGGALFLAILSAPFSLHVTGSTNYFLVHQLFHGLLPGLVLAVFFYLVSLKFLKKIAPYIFFINLALIFAVFLPAIGANYGGSSRWIDLKVITFQPSEFLKLTTILYLGVFLKEKLKPGIRTKFSLKKIKKIKKRQVGYIINILVPFGIIMGIITAAFILQPDVSTLGIISITALLVYFAAKTPLWHMFIIILAGTGLLGILVKFSSYRFNRFLILLNPHMDPLGKGFQMKQSLIAIGSGGVWGKGIGYSSQKFSFLPHPMSDTIFHFDICRLIGFGIEYGNQLAILSIGDEKNCR